QWGLARRRANESPTEPTASIASQGATRAVGAEGLKRKPSPPRRDTCPKGHDLTDPANLVASARAPGWREWRPCHNARTRQTNAALRAQVARVEAAIKAGRPVTHADLALVRTYRARLSADQKRYYRKHKSRVRAAQQARRARKRAHAPA